MAYEHWESTQGFCPYTKRASASPLAAFFSFLATLGLHHSARAFLLLRCWGASLVVACGFLLLPWHVGISVPRPRMEPETPALAGGPWIHCTTRESLAFTFLLHLLPLLLSRGLPPQSYSHRVLICQSWKSDHPACLCKQSVKCCSMKAWGVPHGCLIGWSILMC